MSSYTSIPSYIGATGLQGATGLRGATGPGVGDQGVTGVQGIQGATGAGIQGVTGAVGAAGATGVQGQTGAGLQGVTGAAGAAGAAGSQGATGVQGQTGVAGAAGSQGATGVSGGGGLTHLLLVGDSALGTTGIGGATGINWDSGLIPNQAVEGAPNPDPIPFYGINVDSANGWNGGSFYYVVPQTGYYDLLFTATVGTFTPPQSASDSFSFGFLLNGVRQGHPFPTAEYIMPLDYPNGVEFSVCLSAMCVQLTANDHIAVEAIGVYQDLSTDVYLGSPLFTVVYRGPSS